MDVRDTRTWVSSADSAPPAPFATLRSIAAPLIASMESRAAAMPPPREDAKLRWMLAPSTASEVVPSTSTPPPLRRAVLSDKVRPWATVQPEATQVWSLRAPARSIPPPERHAMLPAAVTSERVMGDPSAARAPPESPRLRMIFTPEKEPREAARETAPPAPPSAAFSWNVLPSTWSWVARTSSPPPPPSTATFDATQALEMESSEPSAVTAPPPEAARLEVRPAVASPTSEA
mmetsp:Transcript_43588/g.139035  ORF Transcript_43588/g.139035 Transcript_43588/m.139035 type:complete len:233 (-) Transcript_43588:1411-2109(-)